MVHREMSDPGYLEQRAADLLKSAFPERQVMMVKRRDGSNRARTDIVGSSIVKYAYLDPGPAGSVLLSVYPGDTLTQAKRLYRDQVIVSSVLDLRDAGWVVRPNFHFGFIARGLTWTRTPIDVDEYVTYWMGRIRETGEWPRESWVRELDALVTAGVFLADDLQSFDEDFTSTNRQTATPRPGLVAEFVWGPSSSLLGELGIELRSTLEQAETAVRTDSPGTQIISNELLESSVVSTRPIEPFDFTWPDKTTEHFSRGWMIRAQRGVSEVQLRHGLGLRSAYGRKRVRSVTWVNRIPTVEGVEADDYERSRSLLSALRHPNKKLVRSQRELSPAYADFVVVDHRSEIDAPYSRRGLAAKIAEDDLESWARLALLRAHSYGRIP